MYLNFNYLFYFLDKEQIPIDKTEFLFQIQSHPDYPSLLSISDTLTFFNIDNGAIRVDFSDIELLPNRFVVLLNKTNSTPELCFIEKKDNKYFITQDKKTVEISIIDLEKKWTDVVLIIEKSELETPKSNYSKFSLALPILCLLFFLFVIFKYETNFLSNLFFIFPVLGLLFSVAALKDLFGAKSELISNFCNFSSSTSCESIVGSDKWKVFSYINFSDLAIVFFGSQFLGLLSLLIAGNSSDFFVTQLVLLFGSIPIILLSLYFQKFVEKKWCPICLVIISIIVLEVFYLVAFFDLNFQVSFQSLLLFGLVFLFTTLIWTALKKLLTNNKELKEIQLKSNRFIRNYEIFKNILISKPKAELPFTPIILGNKESKTIITIITSPFCGHCKSVHELIEEILSKYKEVLKIEIILKCNLENDNEEKKYVFRTLLQTYFDKGEKEFSSGLKEWFLNKNLKLFKEKLNTKINLSIIDIELNQQKDWCLKNNYHLTPTIFINGFEFPKLYERPHLDFFINELIEDENF